MSPALLVCLSALVLVVGCDGFGNRYAAEVGYHEGEAEKWNVWSDFASLDECRNAAISQFNSYNVERAGRAFSWACLLKSSDGGYESRHR